MRLRVVKISSIKLFYIGNSMYKLSNVISFIAIIFCVSLVGCKSTGNMQGSTKTKTEIPTINNLFLISELTSYDLRFKDNISTFFATSFIEQLKQSNIKSNYFQGNDVLSLQQNSGRKQAIDQGYKYILNIRFYNFNLVDGNFIHGDLEARLTEIGKSEAIWVGIFNWRRGCVAYASHCTSQFRAKALADIVLAGMYKDNVLKKDLQIQTLSAPPAELQFSLEEKAKKGDSDSQVKYGISLLSTNSTESFKWFQLSANQNNSLGQTWLANLYKDGKGVTKDIDKAIELYIKAAAQGQQVSSQMLTQLKKDYPQKFLDKDKLVNMEKGKSKCIELGFKKDTESFGDCVLKFLR